MVDHDGIVEKEETAAATRKEEEEEENIHADWHNRDISEEQENEDNNEQEDEEEDKKEDDDDGDVLEIQEERFQRVAAAIFRGAPLESIQEMIKQAEEEEEEDSSNTNNGGVHHTRRLTEMQCSDTGKTLLHYALIKASTPLAVIQYLIHNGPDTLTLRDEDNRTPLHAACGYNCCYPNSFERVQLLYAANPETVRLRTQPYGETPLMLAVDHNYRTPPMEIIQFLAREYPLASLLRDMRVSATTAGSSLVELVKANYTEGIDPCIGNDSAVRFIGEAGMQLLDFLKELEDQTARDLIQAIVYQTYSNGISPRDVEELLSLSDDSLRDQLHPPRLKNFVGGLARMKQAGRSGSNSSTGINRAHAVQICAVASHELDCLFLYLCENPLLCHRERTIV